MAAGILCLIAAVFFLYGGRQTLILVNADTGALYAQWDCNNGDAFSVEFIHSVNKSPVCDLFEIRENTIYAAATRYSAFGAGVQTEITDGQSLIYDSNGNMIVSGFQTPFPEVSYIVGTVSDHVLTIDGQRISLTALCGKNAPVAFRLQKTIF